MKSASDVLIVIHTCNAKQQYLSNISEPSSIKVMDSSKDTWYAITEFLCIGERKVSKYLSTCNRCIWKCSEREKCGTNVSVMQDTGLA